MLRKAITPHTHKPRHTLTALQVWQLVAACVILSLPGQWMILCAISLGFMALAVAYAVASSLLAKRRAKQAKAQAASVK